jgi:hypothetical protein
MGISGRGQNAAVTEDFLYFEQIDAGFDQMGGIAMATGITTLLMNRNPFEFTTGIMPTTASPSTSSGV